MKRLHQKWPESTWTSGREGLRGPRRAPAAPLFLVPIAPPSCAMRESGKVRGKDKFYAAPVLDHAQERQANGSVSVYADADGTILERHMWYDGSNVQTSAWFIALPASVIADTIEPAIAAGSKLTLKGGYTVTNAAKQTAKKAEAKKERAKKRRAARDANGAGKGRHALIFGKHSATSVLRWMSKNGFSIEQARTVMSGLGVTPKDGTLRAQMSPGCDRYGAPAELTADERQQLLAARPKEEPAAKKPPAAKAAKTAEGKVAAPAAAKKKAKSAASEGAIKPIPKVKPRTPKAKAAAATA